MLRKQATRMLDAGQIEAQAQAIKAVMQYIITACESGQAIDPYARNKVLTGGLAQDAAVLAMMIQRHEQEQS